MRYGTIFRWPQATLLTSKIWRFATPFFFFGKLGFPFLMNVYFLYSYSLQLETGVISSLMRLHAGVYEHTKGDYVYMLLICCAELLLVGYALDLMVESPRQNLFTDSWHSLGDCHIVRVVRCASWSNCPVLVRHAVQGNKQHIKTFSLTFLTGQAIYLPWVLAGFNILLGGKCDFFIDLFFCWHWCLFVVLICSILICKWHYGVHWNCCRPRVSLPEIPLPGRARRRASVGNTNFHVRFFRDSL